MQHKSVVGGMFYVTKKTGILSAKIIAQQGNTLTLDPPLAIEPDDVWVIHKDVQSRLFRAVSITENVDEGTYSISAISHDPKKYDQVDTSANFPTTINKIDTSTINNVTVSDEGGKINVGWDGSVSGSFVSYDIKIYRNGIFFRHIPDAKTANIELGNLPSGNYRLEIRGRTAQGNLSEPQTKTFVIDYTITGFQAKPGLHCVQLTWTNPLTVVNQASTEIFINTEDKLDSATLLVSVPYPTSTYTYPIEYLRDQFFFWARFKDETGVSGNFTTMVEGHADPDPKPILDQIAGSLNMDMFEPGTADKLLEEVGDFAGDDTEMAGDDRIRAGKWDIYSQVTSGDYALTKKIFAVQSQFNQNVATVAEQITTLADKQHAESEKLSVVAAQAENNKAQVTEVARSFADLNGKLSASWQVQVSVDNGAGQPVVGGIHLGVDGESGESEFVVQSDRFAIWNGQKTPMFIVQDGITGINGDLIVSGTLSGKTLIGNELRGGAINGGSLNIGSGRFTVDQFGNVSIRENSWSNTGLVITNQTILVFDERGVLRLKMGRL